MGYSSAKSERITSGGEGREGGREGEERGGEGWLSGYKKKRGGCVAESKRGLKCVLYCI